MSGLIDAMTGDPAIEDGSINDDSTLFEEEASVTHPRCYSSDHVEKLETFAGDLNQALKTSFPSRPNPYTSVHVLLFWWTEDDLGVQSEIFALRRAFETRFHFPVQEWQIPSVNPTRALQKKLYDFQEAHQSETELLIVYYGGHAKADSRRGRSIWQAHSRPGSPSANWSSIQPLLETAVPHVLIILDCCFAATAARDTTEGTTKELLAACGRESPTLGVGQRSFTSALIEEIQAFDGAPFTAAMLHSRLVTMRWRLAFTPIYALLSERGGNSITICPLVDDRGWPRSESSILAELEGTDNSPGVQASYSPSMPTSEKQTVDTRVLLTVSVVQDATHDVSRWVSWLTTAAPSDITKVDVQVHSVFKSYSTLVVVSVLTYAWDRLPERPAYRFVGFIRSGDELQAAEARKTSVAETLSGRRTLSLAPHRHEQVPSSFPSLTAIQSQLPRSDTILFGADDMKTPTPKPVQPWSSVHEAEGIMYPSNSPSSLESTPQSHLINQRHKRRGTDTVAEPAAKVLRRSSRFSVSGSSPPPPKAAVEPGDIFERHDHNLMSSSAWTPEQDKLLMRARQKGLNWQSVASQYFPDRTANACRKRHERLLDKSEKTGDGKGVKMDILSKDYLELRELMWKPLANRLGEKWDIVEAKCMETGLVNLEAVGKSASRLENPDVDFKEVLDNRFPTIWQEISQPYKYKDEEEGFNDSAIGPSDSSTLRSVP